MPASLVRLSISALIATISVLPDMANAAISGLSNCRRRGREGQRKQGTGWPSQRTTAAATSFILQKHLG